MIKIAVFDKYLGYAVGGAQASLHFIIENLEADFSLIGLEMKKSFSASRQILENWNVKRIKIFEFSKFPYFEYFLSRKKIMRTIAEEKGDVLLANGMWGAVAVLAWNGPSVYFIRDEYQLNRIPDFSRGFKKFFKKIYFFLQKPFIKLLFQDNFSAVSRATLIIANSRFMAEQIKKFFNRESEVIYPAIDVENLILKRFSEKGEFVVLMGSEEIKGRRVIEKIAETMPEEKFLIVGREFSKPIQRGNILYFPWDKNPLNIYKKAKVVLVPSLCEEAFCRVGLEAMALGVPVFGSNKGGIPELLEEDQIVSDVWDVNQWREKIENSRFVSSEKLMKRAMFFDSKEQMEKIKNLLQKITIK